MNRAEIETVFGKSEQNNFYAVDSIGVPHPYCITPKHLEYCESMYLNAESIARAESKGAKCDICRKLNRKYGNPILSYAEHKQALLIECKTEIQTETKNNPELKAYLLKIKELTEKHGFEGWAFIKAKDWKP